MVQPQEISREQACTHLEQFNFTDPQGLASIQSVVDAGRCYALDLPDGQLVYVLQMQGQCLWILGAAGFTRHATAPGLMAVEQQALEQGCSNIGFQTARPGLVKLAKKSGYRVTGWILSKEVASNDSIV